jgi:hypothetical protein
VRLLLRQFFVTKALRFFRSALGKLNIICKIEDSMNGSNGSSQWRDVTPQNAALTTKLETWLYEQIEPEIK